MHPSGSGLIARVRALFRPAALSAVVCFGAAVACSFLVRPSVGALLRPCDPASGGAPVVLALPELSRSPLNPRIKPEGCVRVSGYWMQAERADAEVRLVADGAAFLAVDGVLVAERAADAPGRMARGQHWLEVGAHRFDFQFEPEGLAQLRGAVVGKDGAKNLDPTFLRAPLPWEYLAERASRLLVWLASVFLVLALAAWLLSPGLWRPLLALVVLAALLRFEALSGVFGAGLPGPTASSLVRLAHSLRPDTWTWEKSLTPYSGGDPMNYIKFSRQMSGFFDAHVREPLFVALGRFFIVDLGFGDIGISIASMLSSCALVAGTFVFARARFGNAVGVVAAGLLAVDPKEISLSVEGWRDGTFAASFVLALWALERARLDPSRTKVALTGAILGASCLIRLSGLSYVAPALLDLALFAQAPRSRRFAAAGLALGVTAFLVAPFMIACAIAYGDPLYPVNYHLLYYHPDVGGRPATSAASAYIFSLHDPWNRAHTFIEGMTSYPFVSRWSALELWFGASTALISGASLLGLVGWLDSSAGRRLLLLTAAALVPFSFTWMAPGGSEYRFTLFAYPVYLAAAGWFVAAVWTRLRGGLMAAFAQNPKR